MRRINLTQGFYSTIQFDFGFISGNSDILILKGNFRTDIKSTNYYTFGVIQYQQGIQESKPFINRGFIHLRHRYSPTVIYQVLVIL